MRVEFTADYRQNDSARTDDARMIWKKIRNQRSRISQMAKFCENLRPDKGIPLKHADKQIEASFYDILFRLIDNLFM